MTREERVLLVMAYLLTMTSSRTTTISDSSLSSSRLREQGGKMRIGRMPDWEVTEWKERNPIRRTGVRFT